MRRGEMRINLRGILKLDRGLAVFPLGKIFLPAFEEFLLAYIRVAVTRGE